MRRGKRTFDLACGVLGLGVGAPIFLAVAALVFLADGRPVFFRQERVGLHGRTLWMWKFRSMRTGSDRKGALLTVGDDPRVTRVGRWLRRFKLDELPQLLNVIAGDMSIVGPRPEVGRYVRLYSTAQRRVLDLVPGITDPASIRYRDESALLGTAGDPEQLYVAEILPEKIRLNLEYAERATVCTDLALVLRTLGALFPRSGR
ncbi:MAG: sugar transferase [Gemmatimonadaceae bacterium]